MPRLTSFQQSALRAAPGVLLMGVAAVGGAWALAHHEPRHSALDGAQLPTLSRPTAANVLDGTFMANTDAYFDHRLPARRQMLETHAAVVTGALRSPVLSDVYLPGPHGQLLERPPHLAIRDSLAAEAEGLQRNVGDVPILWLYAPRKEELYASDVPRAWPSNYADAKQAILGAWSGHGTVVDLSPLVGAHLSEGASYFRTDHHWLPVVAKEAADAAASDLGSVGVAVGTDERAYAIQSAPFLFFGSTGRIVTSGATAPDEFQYPVPAGGFQATMCLDGTCGLPTFDTAAANDPAKYANRYTAFIGGDNGFVTITNDSPTARGHVLLLKDSYGDSFATYLAERVAQLDVIDERHYDGAPLDQLVAELRPDAVIVLHNPLSYLSDSFDPSVWTLSGNVETVEPHVVGRVAIARSDGLLLQVGFRQKVDSELAADAKSLVSAIESTGTPQLWLMAPRKEVVYQDLIPDGVPNQVVPNSAAVLKALERATPVVDLTAALSDPALRDSYFLRTDHHWTVTGADVAVDRIVEGLASKGVTLGDDDREWRSSVGPLPFYGSEAISLPPSEPVIPDELEYDTPVGGFRATLCFTPTDCGRSPINDTFLTDPGRETNRYRAFLGGGKGLMHLHNDDPAARGTVVLLTDSFGAPVAVKLGERTRDLYLIDERKWTGGPVADFVNKANADAVVVLHNPVTILSKAFNRDVWKDAGG